MDRRYDLAMAIVICALGVFVISFARTLSLGIYLSVVGTRTFFYGVGTMFVVCGGMVVINLLRSWKSQKGHMIPAEGETDEEGYPASGLMAASVIGSCILYTLLLDPIGYLITTPLFLIGGMLILKERNWWGIALFAVIFTAVSYYGFAIVLSMHIPVGPFTDWFREMGWIIL